MKVLILTVILLCVSLTLCAEYNFYQPTFNMGSGINVGGLLNPDKVKMNHSMSFASGMASNGYGMYQSAYTNHMQFNLRENLKLNMDLSLVNYGSMTHQNNLNFSSNDDNKNAVVPAFSLQYKPTDNTTFYIEYRQERGFGSPFGFSDHFTR